MTATSLEAALAHVFRASPELEQHESPIRRCLQWVTVEDPTFVAALRKEGVPEQLASQLRTALNRFGSGRRLRRHQSAPNVQPPLRDEADGTDISNVNSPDLAIGVRCPCRHHPSSSSRVRRGDFAPPRAFSPVGVLSPSCKSPPSKKQDIRPSPVNNRPRYSAPPKRSGYQAPVAAPAAAAAAAAALPQYDGGMGMDIEEGMAIHEEFMGGMGHMYGGDEGKRDSSSPQTPFGFHQMDNARPGGGGVPHLPQVQMKEAEHAGLRGWPRISPKTLAGLLQGDFDHKGFSGWTILDARWKAEYDAGHIRNAVHARTNAEVIDALWDKNGQPLRDNKHLVIIHCEFSQERGPNLMKAITDYRDNYGSSEDYPIMYVLDGGYRAFWHHAQAVDSTQILCDGQYKKEDALTQDELEAAHQERIDRDPAKHRELEKRTRLRRSATPDADRPPPPAFGPPLGAAAVAEQMGVHPVRFKSISPANSSPDQQDDRNAARENKKAEGAKKPTSRPALRPAAGAAAAAAAPSERAPHPFLRSGTGWGGNPGRTDSSQGGGRSRQGASQFSRAGAGEQRGGKRQNQKKNK
ncbi:unnamed protein product [Vitrella brassicaformis CCMP3155]|uniref:protein-tyrosine-phosphatase n=3 Tax=Vitrella brassicaformis TaxID=1169539 RepID=A0A0G4EPD4_VITBC|nr:unnamed protein product [Vitrella brassicaformis CCMP3155]|eukprot:CEL99677.1 unnamed protein product [Vitrella brassicaformis CCMP3155]